MTEAESRPTDEEILAFSQEVTASATTDVPLVGASSIASLQAEYSDNPIFRTKIDALVTASPAGKYYRTRGDGNCFYRAVITSLSFQLCSGDGLQRKEKFKERIGKTRPMLDRAGFSEIVYEDFMDTFLLLLDKDASVILEGLNDAETSNSAVVFLRLVTAAQIKTHPDVYLPFVDLSGGHGGQLDRWVERSVEAMDAEADNVQIHALVHALGLAVDVVNLDGTEGAEANVHHVRPDDGDDDVTTDVVIRVLYRPGHYDVLL